MPRLVAAARLHRRQNAHYARMIPAFLQHFLDPILLAETFSAPYKFDLHDIIGREALHVLPKRLAHSLGPLGVVEDSDLVLVKVVGHPTGVAPSWYRPLDDDPVIAGKNSDDLIPVPLRQKFDAHCGIVTDFPVWFRLCRVRA